MATEEEIRLEPPYRPRAPWGEARDEDLLRDARDASYARHRIQKHVNPIDIYDPEYQQSVLEPHYQQTLPELHPGYVPPEPLPPATQEPERLSSDPDSPPQLSYHTPKPPPSDPMGELLAESKALRASIDVITAETQGRLDTSAAALKKNYEQQLANLTATEAKINTALAEQTKTITDFEAALAKLDTVQQEAAADATARVQAINDEIQNYKIDPNRAFRSTWQVVGAAIASAAGAYAQGISPNRIPNTAMAIINKAIDRDIHAQQMELGKLKTQADIQNNVYARMLQQHGDQRRAHAEARIAAITVAELKVKQIQSTAKSSNQKLAIQGVLQKLAYDKEVALAETKTKAMNSKARMIASEMEFLSKGLGGGAKGAVSGDKITARLVNILPLFDRMKKEFDEISIADWAMHTTGVGKHIPGMGGSTARVQKYVQTRTMITKEIVSIFEGSKPSDLDWRVMVRLFPLARHSKDYALPAIENMRDILIARVGKLAAMSPEQRKNATWGFGEAAIAAGIVKEEYVFGVSNEEVAETKALAGWKD